MYVHEIPEVFCVHGSRSMGTHGDTHPAWAGERGSSPENRGNWSFYNHGGTRSSPPI